VARHFDATFEVEGLVFSPNIYVPLDRGMNVLQLCHWKFSLKETFYSKKGKVRFLSHSLGDLDSLRTSSIACWKARIRFPIRRN